MSTRRSRQRARFLHERRSEYNLSEPPTRPLPSSDEPDIYPRSQDNRWGHPMGKKNKETIRIVLQNVDGLPNNTKGDVKLDSLRLFTREAEIDILALTELNAAWDRVDYKARLPVKTQGWWEANQWSVTHNKQDLHGDEFQPGGSAILTLNKLSHKTTKPGDDTTGLGRWCWIRLRGKENHFLRIVSAYRPCKSDGHLTTYQQQVRWLTKQGKSVCPRDQILSDLAAQVEQWTAEGDTILILADINEDVRSDDIVSAFRQMGLVEVVTSQHGHLGPNTHIRGTNPIDGIFIPPQMVPNVTSGYLAFGEGIPSDHRALWIDIPLAVLGWFNGPEPTPLKARRLQCKDPRIIQKYNEVLQQQLDTQKLPQRIEQLSLQIRHHRLTRQQQWDYETIDRLSTEAKRHAESKCRKLTVGRVQWCPQVTRAIAKILYWKGLRKRLSGGHIGAKYLNRTAKKGGMRHSPENLQLEPTAIENNIQKAYKRYAKLKKDSGRRDTWLQQLIEAQAKEQQTPKKTLWKKIRATERIRNNARMIRFTLHGPATRRGLTHVIGPLPADPEKRVESKTKEELETLCLSEAGRRFTQAATTPFLTSPLIELFTESNLSTRAFDQVLSGSFVCPEEVDSLTKRLLATLKRNHSTPWIQPRTLQEITDGWKKAREATSSSPSSIHFGHYMAGTFNPTIAVFNARLANLGFTTGYSLKRWRKGLNVMLEKQPGNFNVEKLRIILLFEGDFNQNNKWLGRAVMFNAESHQQLAREQYGSRKEKAADIQCLNKRLLYDHARFTHEPLALCSNDAKSCYDRIVLIVAALCLCRLGAPKPYVQSMVTTIHGMRHHVRSTYGDSTTSQGRQQWDLPIAGIGQGNGAGPHIWAAISSPLFQILAQEGFLATVICAISKLEYTTAGFGFVDDVDLCITIPNGSGEQVVQQMQKSINTWAGLLRATGGALVPDKCFWYYIHNTWKNGSWQYVRNPTERAMLVPNDNNAPLPIPELPPSEARRTLGVRLAPDGNNKDELRYLVEVAKSWQTSMSGAKITHAAAEFGLRQVILRKLDYPLVATTFTQKECQTIMSPILTAGLPAAGVMRTFPRAMVHGPWQWGGLNIPNLHTEQMTKHLHTILKFGQQLTDTTGCLIQATAEAFLLEAGLIGKILDFPVNVFSYVTPTWISQTWEVCNQHKIQVIGLTSDFNLPRQSDIEIMRLFIRQGYPNLDLRVLNKCRMYLQVTFLSDICEASGRKLDQDNGKCPHRRDSPYHWPTIPAPTTTEWRIWHQAILQSTQAGRNLMLPLPLGKWHTDKADQPGWFYYAPENALFHKTSQGVTRHGIVPRRSRTQAFHLRGEATHTHPNWLHTQVATVHIQGDKVVLTGAGHFLSSRSAADQRWFQRLETSTVGSTWNLTIRSRGSMEKLQHAINSGQALAVSDGSFQNESGACAWIIEGATADDRIEGSMQTPGQLGDHSSFRSEAAGIYGVLLTIWYFSQEYPVTGAITLACDGRSVLDRLRSKRSIDPFAAHSDLLRACHSIQGGLKCLIRYKHVKGHQDSGYPTALERDAWLNIEADKAAKATIRHEYAGDVTLCLPFEPCRLFINQKKIIKQHRREIRLAINGPQAHQYWANKFPGLTQLRDKLDTQAMERALSESTPSRRRWVTKHITGHFAHGKNMQRRGQRTTTTCPRCQTDAEDKVHILRCQADSARTQWKISLQALDRWMKDQGTATEIRTTIITKLEQWNSDDNTQNNTGNHFATAQSHIGWDRMLDGWLTRGWRDHQEKIWKHAKSRKSSLRWTSALIQKLWDVSWDMWDHRNKELFAGTEIQQQITHSLVDDRIKELYAGGAQQLPRDALKFLRQPLETVLKYSLASKQIWLDAVQTAQQQRQKHEHGRYLAEQRFMTTWLLSAQNNSTPVEPQPD